MMDTGLAVGAGRMTIQTGPDPADHTGRIAVTARAYSAGIVTTGRINMTEGTGAIMNPGDSSKTTVGMTIYTVINDCRIIPVGGRMATVVAELVSMTGGTGYTGTGHDHVIDRSISHVDIGVAAGVMAERAARGVLLIDAVPAIEAGRISGCILMTGVTGGIGGSLVNRGTKADIGMSGCAMNRMAVKVGRMTLATFVGGIGCKTIDISSGCTADPGAVYRAVTGVTTVSRMNGTGKRSVAGTGSGMTTDAVNRISAAAAVNDHRGGMIMAVVVEVAAMTTLAILAAGGAGSTALEGTGCRVMTGEAG